MNVEEDLKAVPKPKLKVDFIFDEKSEEKGDDIFKPYSQNPKTNSFFHKKNEKIENFFRRNCFPLTSVLIGLAW
jgi:hypothetical protein